jgi:hypothetical protein
MGNQGYQPSGSGSASAQWTASLNSLYLPLVDSGLPNPIGNVSVQNPIGFNVLCNPAAYTNYRVTAATLSFELVPQVQSDAIIMTTTPSQLDGQPASTFLAQAQPMTQVTTFKSGTLNPRLRNGALVNRVDVAFFAGVPRKSVEMDLSGQYTGTYTTPPGFQYQFVINYNTLDQSDLAAPVGWRLNMMYEVEFWGLTDGDIQ